MREGKKKLEGCPTNWTLILREHTFSLCVIVFLACIHPQWEFSRLGHMLPCINLKVVWLRWMRVWMLEQGECRLVAHGSRRCASSASTCSSTRRQSWVLPSNALKIELNWIEFSLGIPFLYDLDSEASHHDRTMLPSNAVAFYRRIPLTYASFIHPRHESSRPGHIRSRVKRGSLRRLACVVKSVCHATVHCWNDK